MDITIGQTISHYKILEKLGEGGMGIVYKALDTKLNRNVALKFLPSFVADDSLEKVRFVHEAQAISSLNHPHVATIHDIEELGEHKFIVLEYIEGGVLKQKVKHKQLPFNQVLDYSIQIAEGLAYAHRKDIVHRDIKTDNVMLSAEGQIKITDFGLAKLKGVTKLTRSGSTVGTAAYMSPEQALGQEVDRRSDIFSFGVVLFEIATGELPFKGEHEAALMYEIVNVPAKSVKELRSDVPDELQRIIDKALEKDANDRYQYMDELLVDLRRMKKDVETKEIIKKTGVFHVPQKKKLRWVIPALLAGIGVFIIGYLLLYHKAESGEKIPVAVVDFENETEEKELDGLSGMLITSLEQSRRLSVLTRSRMFDILKQMGKEDVTRIDESLGREICRRANVSALVIASVRKFDRLYNIDLKVLDPLKNVYVFTANEKGEGKASIPSMIDELSEKTRIGLREKMAEIQATSQKIADVTTANVEAYQHYFLGEQLMDKTEYKEARKEYERSIELDSTFGLAYYRLAYAIDWDFGNPEATQAIQKALALIDRIPDKEKYLVRALDARIREGGGAGISILREMARIYPHDKEMIYNIGDWSYHEAQYDTAEAYLTRVLSMDPKFERALQHLTWTYRSMGRYKEMLEIAKRYASLAPSEGSYILLGNAYARLGQYETGVEALRKARELFPDKKYSITSSIAELYIIEGEFDKAEAEAKRLLQDQSHEGSKEESRNLLERMGWAYMQSGAPRTAEKTFRKVLTLEPDGKSDGVFNGLGWSLVNQSRYGEAEKQFERGLTINPRNAAILNGLLTVNLRRKNFKEAIGYGEKLSKVLPLLSSSVGLMRAYIGASMFEQADSVIENALRTHPTPSTRRQILTQAGWASLQSPDKAFQYFKRALDLTPESRDENVLDGLGWTLLLQEKYKEAEEFFLRALAENPRHSDVLNGLAELSILRRDDRNARHYLERFLDASPGRRAKLEVECDFAQLALLKKDYSEAERHLRIARRIDSSYARANEYLGYLFTQRGRFSEAREVVERALSQDSSLSLRNLLAWILIAGDLDIERGRTVAQKALDLIPEGWVYHVKPRPFIPVPQHSLGLAFLKKKDYQRAAKHLEEGVRLFPDRQDIHEDLRQARMKLAPSR